jgi:hypothetical protein
LDLPPTSRKRGVWEYNYPITDWTNYNILYYYNDVLPLLNDLKKLYQRSRYLTLDQILLALSPKHLGLNDHALTNALDVIINAQVPIKDALGFDCVLREDNNYFFLDEYQDQNGNYQLSTYTYDPIVSSTETLAGVAEYVALGDGENSALCEYAKQPTLEKLYQLPYSQKVILLEQAFIYRHDHPKKELPKAYQLALRDIDTSIYTLENGKAVHIMFMDEHLDQSFNTIVKKYETRGQTRVFVPGNTDQAEALSYWINETNPQLEEKYIEEIKDLRKYKLSNLLQNEYGLYGSIAQDGKFRIRTLQKRKGETKGMVCSSFKPPDMLKAFVLLKFWPEINDDYKTYSKKKLLEIARAGKRYSKVAGVVKETGLSQDDLVGFASYVNSSLTVSELCFLLKQRLAELGILYDAEGASVGLEQVRALFLASEKKEKTKKRK